MSRDDVWRALASPGRPTDWGLADEWFADFIDELQGSKVRRRKALAERHKALPVGVTLARKFEQETEQFRRYLAAERKRMVA